ncbi:MAG: hypothetical protein KKE73_13090 [Proteobacteria bacterium]|nr:hypothetical protein [Pseudomonadota bacterium]
MSRSSPAPLCALLLAACLLTACDSAPEQVQQPSQQPRASATQRQIVPDKKTSSRELNLLLLQNILTEYRNSHTYTKKDLYICGDMAMDVWNILTTKGFKAKIAEGNNEKDILKTFKTFKTGVTHVWVMAQLGPNDWIALECTGGFMVSKAENPFYYTSAIFFSGPAEYKPYLSDKKMYNTALEEYNVLTNGWNKLIAGKSYKRDSNTAEQINYIKATKDSKSRDLKNYDQKLKLVILTHRKL